ncbi:MAG: hypothetical protein DRJ13_01445 [Bacteroidetes bacterium]|nr:MAG: hypothetical protein DRJ13_01445 [Bacteroidota bacterium]
MSNNPDRLAHFWKELRRRNVLRSLAIYAGTAFIILEACNMLFPRWGLPDWSIDLVFWLLVLGAVINIFMAWVFDLTPEGVKKTKSAADVQESESPSTSNSWKVATYISVVVIVALIIMNVIPFNREARAGTIDSLLILPFDNFTGDDQLDNMVAGMHSMLIGDMGRIDKLRVISPTTSNVYKDADMSIPEIAEELEVGAILDLDMMCMGDTICFQAKIITPFPEEKVLWIADFREEKGQILNLYNRITKQIAREVKVELSPQVIQRLAESRTVDPEALDAYLLAHFHRERLGPDNQDSALKYFQIAIEKDPEWADPYVGLARVWGVRSAFRYISVEEGNRKRYEYQKKALELDPNSDKVHYLIAGTATWTDWDWELADKEYAIAMKLNPNNALSRMYYAHFLMIQHRTEEALKQAKQALELDPMRPLSLGLYGVVMHYTGDYQAALTHLEKGFSIDPENGFVVGNLAVAYRCTGDTLHWFETAKSRWGWLDDKYYTYIDTVFQEKGVQGVIRARVKTYEELYAQGGRISFNGLGKQYLQLGNYDKGMYYFEKAYEEKHGLLSYISLYYHDYPELKDNPRYLTLLKKMKLPLPEE